MSDNPKHVTVRLRVPPELRDKIADSANAHNRSMNADMVARLEKSFEEQEAVSLADIQQEMKKLCREAREMRMLYVESMSERIKALEGLTAEEITIILENAKLK